MQPEEYLALPQLTEEDLKSLNGIENLGESNPILGMGEGIASLNAAPSQTQSKRNVLDSIISKYLGISLGQWQATPKRWKTDNGGRYYGVYFKRDI
jgi:hypothetical protein